MDDNEYAEGIFLKKKLAQKILKSRESEIFNRRSGARGISQTKKDGIRDHLLKFMPQNRHQFWKNLPVNNSSADLIDNE